MDWRSALPVLRQAEEASQEASGQLDMTMFPGGQQDALRHALWNAKMARDYGRIPAGAASMGLEAFEAIKALRLPKEERQRAWDESLMDVKNNLYGLQNPGATIEQLRSAPLESLPHYWGTKK